MSENNPTTLPRVHWAQTPGYIFLTFDVDCENPTVKIEPETMYFENVGKRDKYDVTINFFGEIYPESSVQNATDGLYEVVLAKKVCGIFWPRLNKEKRKFRWLTKDIDKWKDAEEWNLKNPDQKYDKWDLEISEQKNLEEKLRNIEEKDVRDDYRVTNIPLEEASNIVRIFHRGH